MDERRNLERLAWSSINEDDCPDTDLLAAYTLGALKGNEQLQVAAHVRGCPLCQHDIAASRPPEPRRRIQVARLALPSLAQGLRSGSATNRIQHYEAGPLAIDVTIAPPVGELWHITGQVLQQNKGVAGLAITLRSRRQRYQQESDAQGFFTFADMPPNRYTLNVDYQNITFQIRNLILDIE